MPTRKVSVSAVSGAIVVLGLFLLNVFAPKVASQINNAVGAAAVVVVSTVLAYIIPEADQA